MNTGHLKIQPVPSSQTSNTYGGDRPPRTSEGRGSSFMENGNQPIRNASNEPFVNTTPGQRNIQTVSQFSGNNVKRTTTMKVNVHPSSNNSNLILNSASKA